MYQFSYADIMEDAPEIGRERERAAFDRALDLMRIADRPDAATADRIAAAQFVQKLWAVLIDDLTSPENALPEALRADLVSLGLWSMRESNAVLSTPGHSLAALIEVNASIRDGLR
ncbi:MAG: flagellar biosynthesis regulator FlaF [Methylobacterium sp.]|jgi:flagellar protein FlaF|uniref:flagellar biosynthesis regulator FlaF n=1 Tax=unclassified Methylobacterium TaxID=2615210 RepID=UPI0006F67D01|nr:MULTISPECIES: flagellar biosynthesis regulator FlaF [unclassified Methylobacterium]KQP10230.1 flagellar biosynthesis regulator FlaF [Methylobacterium sp. Leaf99]MDO9426166.1 flagellar biosynthesis regulator FlaF [Methylobacterium sp.]TXM69315.1 flagellar biosynthesis regulator FlaF [Methylobacterium sp. WL69]